MAKKRAVKKAVRPTVVPMPTTEKLQEIERAELLEKLPAASPVFHKWVTYIIMATALCLSISGAYSYFSQPATAAATTPNHFPLIASEIGLATINNPSPAPTPAPAPSGKCVNCNGTGKVGDGTVFVPCALCDGKGYTGFSLDLPPFPALETPAPAPVLSPPASLEPAARRSSAVSSSCASGSCGVAGNGGWRPFARLRGR